MTTYNLPPEPPVGTRLVDRDGTEWVRVSGRSGGLWRDLTGGAAPRDWGAVLRFGPLTKVPTPALPTERGTVIRATGSEGGIPFRDRALVRGDSGTWRGDVDGGYVDLSLSRDRIDTFTVLATHDPATQAVVPREEWEALKSEVRSVVASAGADLDPDPYIARKARALVRAAEEAER